VVRADPEQLRIALDALLENAVKYSEAGDRIRLSSREVGGHVAVEVADEGIGIPDAALAHIFERFARADAARTRAAGGVGLGLAIVDTIVKAHGANSRVERLDGETVFTIELPDFSAAAPGPQLVLAPVAAAPLS
jgi:signal transduction histidine kinase